MFSLDGRQLLLFGSTAAALAAGAYVLWGPSEKKKSRKKKGESETERGQTSQHASGTSSLLGDCRFFLRFLHLTVLHSIQNYCLPKVDFCSIRYNVLGAL